MENFGLFVSGIVNHPYEQPENRIFQHEVEGKSKYKNLSYSEEELGFKRKFKGRRVFYCNDNWLIINANPYFLLLNNGKESVKVGYNNVKDFIFEK